jgi:uncharacterized protein with HEPN domain
MAAATVPDRLGHILQSIDAVARYWKGKKRLQFDTDNWGRAATERHLEIISEASRHIPAKDKADHPQIPWKDIANLGNILRHRYDTISDDRIWEIVSLDLPALRTTVKKIMARHRPKK